MFNFFELIALLIVKIFKIFFTIIKGYFQHLVGNRKDQFTITIITVILIITSIIECKIIEINVIIIMLFIIICYKKGGVHK